MVSINKTNYSIIIPHKNIPELLRRCLTSIPKREDVQIIVIDDNSDPSIINFSNFPGIGEPRTEVYLTKEGKGAGYARNIGLQKAKGKWIVFADADDYFNDCFNNVMDQYSEFDSDVIYFQSNSVDSDSLQPVRSRGEVYNRWLEEACKKDIITEEIRYHINPPWAKFFSREFISANSIFFDEVMTGNDVLFSTKTGHLANKITIDLNEIYCATVRSGSLDTQFSYKSAKSRFDIAISQYKYLQSAGIKKYSNNVWFYIDQIRLSDQSNLMSIAINQAFRELGLIDFIYGFMKLLYYKIIYKLR